MTKWVITDLFTCSRKILNFLGNNTIINPVNTFTEDIYRALDSWHLLLSIFVDFYKAFDTVKHVILLQKFSFYGITGVYYKGMLHILCILPTTVNTIFLHTHTHTHTHTSHLQQRTLRGSV